MNNLRGLLGIRRMDRVLNVWIRVVWVYERNYEVFYNGLAILKEWKMIGLLKGCVRESVWVVS